MVSAINTTPLVDVMLVLLIIFLITVPVVTQSVQLELPKERNQPTPVAIAIGHHPALLLAAASQHPGVGGELGLAGSLMGESLGLVKAETQDLLVPAEAEIVIEGYVPPGVRTLEGPFGEFPWYYTETGQRPVHPISLIARAYGIPE